MLKISSLMAIVLAVLLCGCELHSSDNGDLDGFWQLYQMDTIATNHSAEVRHLKIFWAVQGDMLEMRDLHDLDATQCHEIVNFYFRLDGGKLYLSDPIVNNREISDSIVTQPSTLEFYGVTQLDEVFDVLQLDGCKMILQSDRYRLYFNRY